MKFNEARRIGIDDDDDIDVSQRARLNPWENIKNITLADALTMYNFIDKHLDKKTGKLNITIDPNVVDKEKLKTIKLYTKYNLKGVSYKDILRLLDKKMKQLNNELDLDI